MMDAGLCILQKHGGVWRRVVRTIMKLNALWLLPNEKSYFLLIPDISIINPVCIYAYNKAQIGQRFQLSHNE